MAYKAAFILALAAIIFILGYGCGLNRTEIAKAKMAVRIERLDNRQERWQERQDHRGWRNRRDEAKATGSVFTEAEPQTWELVESTEAPSLTALSGGETMLGTIGFIVVATGLAGMVLVFLVPKVLAVTGSASKAATVADQASDIATYLATRANLLALIAIYKANNDTDCLALADKLWTNAADCLKKASPAAAEPSK